MKLNCTHCGQDIHTDNANLDQLVATCWSCHAVYDLSVGRSASWTRK